MFYICAGIILAVSWIVYFCIFGIKEGLEIIKEGIFGDIFFNS